MKFNAFSSLVIFNFKSGNDRLSPHPVDSLPAVLIVTIERLSLTFTANGKRQK